VSVDYRTRALRCTRALYLSIACRTTNCTLTGDPIFQGFTPLHLAASQGDLNMVKFLINFGSSMYCKDKVSNWKVSVVLGENTRVWRSLGDGRGYCVAYKLPTVH
jgi:hypothetical protein